MKSLLFVAILAALATVPTAAEVVEGIVVRVNERILTIADMRRRALEKAAELGKPIPAEEFPELVQEAADELCLLERALELKIEIAPEEVDQAVTQLRQSNRIASEAAFDAMLREMGLSLSGLRSRLRDTITINRVLQKEVGELPITEQELKNRWEREREAFLLPEKVHIIHAVFAAEDEQQRQRELARARRLAAAAASGSDFAALVAAEVAQGNASGGDLGELAVVDLRSEVRQAVEALQPGEISEPFVTSAGVHVLQLISRTPPTVKPFTPELREELYQKELAERYQARLRQVVDRLKRRYVVETRPELFTPPQGS
jgi:parvulin-like peptidyl-prolyl isomerase